jgi:Streptomyces sporulation and cell division protein, SsgA
VNANSVTQEISLRTSAWGQEPELRATFSYDASEPHEVRMTFHDSLAEPIVWVFARSLLAEGLSTRAGEGLVETWPAGDGQNLVISLCSPKGTRAEFTAPAVSLASFLEATYWLVAPGAEPARTDIDAGIAAILAWGAS